MVGGGGGGGGGLGGACLWELDMSPSISTPVLFVAANTSVSKTLKNAIIIAIPDIRYYIFILSFDHESSLLDWMSPSISFPSLPLLFRCFLLLPI